VVTSERYIPRVVDTQLRSMLSRPTAVVLEGAKGVGKTETATYAASSRVLLDVDEGARVAAVLDASLIIAGETPRLVDEWQEVPSIWNHVRRAVDEGGGPFILTGSAVPPTTPPGTPVPGASSGCGCGP
jgi:predicted AAA+ superfamily ATPase